MPRLTSFMNQTLAGIRLGLVDWLIGYTVTSASQVYTGADYEPWIIDAGNQMRNFGGSTDVTPGDIIAALTSVSNTFNPSVDTERATPFTIRGETSGTTSTVTEYVNPATNGTALRLQESNGFDYIGNEDGGTELLEIADIAWEIRIEDGSSSWSSIASSLVSEMTLNRVVELVTSSGTVRGIIVGNGISFFQGYIYITKTSIVWDTDPTEQATLTSIRVYLPSWKLLYTLDNPNAYDTSALDQFGHEVSIFGDYLIASTPRENDAGGNNSGKAYIFHVANGALAHTLDNPNAYGTSADDLFGESSDIDENYAIVGAPFEDDAGGNDSGKAYIFHVANGALAHTLDNPNAYDTSVGDQFGRAVAISGNYAIVGAKLEDDAGGTSSGKAYIFDVTNGNLLHTLDNPNAYSTSADDFFGNKVAISGNYAIVGAVQEKDENGSSSGKAYIFHVANGALAHTLDNPNPYGTSLSDSFGTDVSISENYAVVSALFEDDAGGSTSGRVYVYHVANGALAHTIENPEADGGYGDLFGEKVDIDANTIIVPARQNDEGGVSNTGRSYIFDAVSGDLIKILENPNAYNTGDFDGFGWDVSINGNYAVVSTIFEDDAGGSASGKVYVFRFF